MTRRRSPRGAWVKGEMDEIARLIDTVLTATTPGPAADGSASKGKYMLEEKTASDVARQAADLLADHPLYPTVDLG